MLVLLSVRWKVCAVSPGLSGQCQDRLIQQKVLGLINFCCKVVTAAAIGVQLLNQCAVGRNNFFPGGAFFESQEGQRLGLRQASGSATRRLFVTLACPSSSGKRCSK